MKPILIVTEANEKVASGHLMECIEIADVLLESGYPVIFMINDDMPDALRSRIPIPYTAYRHGLAAGKEDIRKTLVDHAIDLLIFNFRFVEDEMLQHIRQSFRGIILCVDELGHRHLSCDVIVNPMIDPYYHIYTDSSAKLYAGAEYLVLPRSLATFHDRPKVISDEVRQVCVSMGGVDPFGTTLKLAEWLPKILPTAKMDLVLGGGFQYASELESIVAHNEKIEIHKNINYIYELFFRADLTFCAGGNTLHELACIGTPTVVIPSMPHEVRNGKMFERLGFGKCLSITHDVQREEVQDSIQQYRFATERKVASKNGKALICGKGAINTKRIVDEYIPPK